MLQSSSLLPVHSLADLPRLTSFSSQPRTSASSGSAACMNCLKVRKRPCRRGGCQGEVKRESEEGVGGRPTEMGGRWEDRPPEWAGGREGQQNGQMGSKAGRQGQGLAQQAATSAISGCRALGSLLPADTAHPVATTPIDSPCRRRGRMRGPPAPQSAGRSPGSTPCTA